MDDGWTRWWHDWFREGADCAEATESAAARTLWVRDRVRAAVQELGELERAVIEGYYYDGLSLDGIGAQAHLSKNRVVVAHRRALAALRVTLAPLVAEAFGIGAVCELSCPICTGEWRGDAEAMLDGKTAEMTWGELIIRLERAFGWKANGPRVLIVHQKRHRMFQSQVPAGENSQCTIRPSPQPSPSQGEGAEPCESDLFSGGEYS